MLTDQDKEFLESITKRMEQAADKQWEAAHIYKTLFGGKPVKKDKPSSDVALMVRQTLLKQDAKKINHDRY